MANAMQGMRAIQFHITVDQQRASKHFFDALSSHPCSGRACHPEVEGLAIDGRLQRHGRRVAQGGHGEAGRFGHLNELGKALGGLTAVERQFCANRVAQRFCIASEDGAFA